MKTRLWHTLNLNSYWKTNHLASKNSLFYFFTVFHKFNNDLRTSQRLSGGEETMVFPYLISSISNFQGICFSNQSKSCFVLINKGTCSSNKICSVTYFNMIIQRELFKGYVNTTNTKGIYSKTTSKVYNATSTIFQRLPIRILSKVALTPKMKEASQTWLFRF